MWRWLDGKKTTIGAVTQLATLVMPTLGVPAQALGWVQMAANAILGLGVLHKSVKAMRKAPPA